MISRDSKFGTGGIKRELFGRYVTPREFKHGARDIPFGQGAKSLHVDGINGNDHSDGESWLTAFKTIQAGAIDHAESWTDIFIKASIYAENVSISESNVSLIGESIASTIVEPASGDAIVVSGDDVSLFSLFPKAAAATKYCLKVTGDRCLIDTIALDGPTDSLGIDVRNSFRSSVKNIYASNANLRMGIQIWNSPFAEVSHNYLYLTRGVGWCIVLEYASKALVHDNEISDQPVGVLNGSHSSGNTVFHNNFIGNSTQITDYSGNNLYFGNYFDDHTNVDNGFGIATAAYSFTTGSDPRPVVIRNGWLGLSFGHTLSDILDDLNLEAFHVSFFFPEDSNETITITAGGAINTFGAWAEIVDNNAVTFSSKIASNIGHISMIGVEDVSATDKIYMLEIAYGDAKTVVTRHRILVGVGKVTSCQTRVRPLKIPAGETVYYRLKCETGGATALVNLKYHFH